MLKQMLGKVVDFYRALPPAERPASLTDEQAAKLTKKLRLQSFFAGTLGYSLYYVCRTGLNVVKTPIVESGMLNDQQLGIVGSALLFAYAIGKFVNSFMADHSNIKRFMATGLIVSSIANLIVGILGMTKGLIGLSSMAFFVCFFIMWALNGWSQSMGAGPAIIALSRWFSPKERGTYYGFFSASHNLGEFFSFIFVGSVVGWLGWQAGFMGSFLAGAIGVVIILFFLHDSPESKGLPHVGNPPKESTDKAQKGVLRNPYVWILALASAFMYVSRYAVNSWGVRFLEMEKGYSLELATTVIGINALLGIFGTVLSGWFSDKFFKGKRNMPAFIFGVLNTIALTLFLLGGDSLVLNVISMVFFGIAIGVLICFLGGLMAVDIAPRNASGAALGVVGIASYVGAGIQDVMSGILIEGNKAVVDGVEVYDFTAINWFWIGAAVLSVLCALMVWNAKAPAND